MSSYELLTVPLIRKGEKNLINIRVGKKKICFLIFSSSALNAWLLDTSKNSLHECALGGAAGVNLKQKKIFF